MYAVCPGGEVADLKSVELKGFAGSNPVCSAFEQAILLLLWSFFD